MSFIEDNIDDLIIFLEDNNTSLDWEIVKKEGNQTRRKLVGKEKVVIDADEDSEIEPENEDNSQKIKEMKEMIYYFLQQKYEKEINRRIRYIQKEEREKEGANLEAYKERKHQIKEMERKTELLKKELEDYKGNGKGNGPKKIVKSSLMPKPAYAGAQLCSVSALLNLFVCMSMTFMRTSHPICHHKDRCALCLVRSAISKTILSKGRYSYTEVPEILSNMHIFLGPHHCPKCYECFSTEENKNKHMKSTIIHRKKQISIKMSLDNLIAKANITEELHLPVMCKKCGVDINENENGYIILNERIPLLMSLEKLLQETINDMMKKHKLKHKSCSNSSYIIKPKDILMIFIKKNSLLSIQKNFKLQTSIYELEGQLSHDLSHSYARIKKGKKWMKMDEKVCTEKLMPANPTKTVIAVYKRRGITDALDNIEKFIYPSASVRYFRESTEEYRNRKKETEKTKYETELEHRDRKKEVDKERKKSRYDEDEEHRNRKKEAEKERAKSRYDEDEEHRNRKKEKLNMKYLNDQDFRNRRKEDSKRNYYKQNNILKLINQNFINHDSGFEHLCVSCLTLKTKNNVTKYKINVNEEKDGKLLLLEKTLTCDNYYLCKTCRSALIKGFPKLNFVKLHDIDNIGAISRKLPDLNLMEKYLLKLTIPFIRVAHVPRSPNLKLIGGSICIQADLSHTIERLNINPENIIPISFKRKLEYRGFYLEQVIDKRKVFEWLDFLRIHNPLYKNIMGETEASEQIDEMSRNILSELVEYDEFRVLKSQLEDRNETETKKITEDFINSDSDDDDSDSLEDTKTEAIGENEVLPNDTFLYHVNELCLEESTVANGIAKYVFETEKSDAIIRKSVQDEDKNSEYENYYFKEHQDADEIDTLEGIEDTDFFEEFEPENGDRSPEKIIKEVAFDKIKQKFSSLNKLSRKKKKNMKEKATVVAPGENQKFDNKYKYQEEKCFPTLFPKGTGGYASTYLDMGLGIANYCKLRLTGGVCVENNDLHAEIKKMEEDSCVDYERFRRDHHYLMFLLLMLDSINMRRAQETAFRKVTRLNKYRVDSVKVTEQDRALLERRNIGYRTFKHIRGKTP